MNINNLDLKELQKLPEIDVDYNLVNLVLYRRAIPKFPSGYTIYDDYTSGDIGMISESDIAFQRLGNYTFEMDFFSKSRHWGLQREYYYLVKKNNWLKYKIYLKSFLKDLNMRVLYTLQIWDLLERKVGKYPSWDDLKILKWFRK